MRALLFKIDDTLGLMTIFYYGIIGATSAAINFIAFALLWDVLDLNYKLAVTGSYFLAILFNFISNRHFTFKSSGNDFVRHLYKYLTMIGINYAITMSVIHAAVENLSFSPYVGLLASIAITAVTGFLLSKFWIFKGEAPGF